MRTPRHPLAIALVPAVLCFLVRPASPTDAADAALATTATLPSPLGCGEEQGTDTAATVPATLVTPPSAGSLLETVADVPMPGGPSRFDYQSLDPTAGRLYIAHMGAGQLVVVDTVAQTVVGTVDDLPTVTGVLAVPELGRVFASVAGEDRVAVIDAESLQVVARVGEIGFPDGLAYAPTSRQVFVSDGADGHELVLDADGNAVAATIDLGGTAGNTQYDPGSGCVLVAVEPTNELVAIDPTTDRIAGRYSLDAGCEVPHGVLVDAPRRLAFVACEDSATLLVVDLRTMAVTAVHDVGEDPDVLALDPAWGRLYVAAESGVVSVFAERGSDLLPLGEVAIPHAHSVAVDPSTHLVYLPLEDVGGAPVLRIMAPGAPD